MNVRESINRGFNLLAVGIVGLSGFAFAPEIFLEKDWDDKADDILILILGIVSIIWYSRKNNRMTRSVAPVVFVIIALALKILAVVIEHGDTDSVGDDIGALVLFVLAAGFILFQYTRTKKLLDASST